MRMLLILLYGGFNAKKWDHVGGQGVTEKIEMDLK
jgi:hypothetical protein